MLIKRLKGWELPEREATPETIYVNRRRLLAGAGALAASGVLGALPGGLGVARAASDADPSAGLYPAPRNAAYQVQRPLTPEEIASTYNNFYEFGSYKTISRAAQALKTRPWTVRIDGEVENEMELDIDTLLAKVDLEERVYRHRCVEAWSMVVPWTGFPVAKLVALANPRSSAKYLRMETFLDASMAPGQKQFWYPWPYVEAITMAEATNDLAFLVTGVYGKPAAKQFGAPLRLALPWKYGFKSIKSIVRFSFVSERPKGMWEVINASEYGFWANVNPQVPHPRWSQASERDIGTEDRIPTRLFNGYGEQVASLYADLQDQPLYM